MNSIAYIDTEIEPNSSKILDIGCVRENGDIYHSDSVSSFIDFLHGTKYACGHNFLMHDIRYIHDAIEAAGISSGDFIDTLFLSPLLFPARPYHSLLKDDKLQTGELNNPLNDSFKARDLLNDEIAAFREIDDRLKRIYYTLIKDKKEFGAFFRYIGYDIKDRDAEKTIRAVFRGRICTHADLSGMISEHPVELSYALALINTDSRYSITPPWVIRNYPYTENIMFQLRNKPCIRGCDYCVKALDIKRGLKSFFGFDSFKTYAGEPLQEKAVKAAVSDKSLLAVFPTGGGKSVTFQLPALISGVSVKGLTVVISPLLSLMKDQIDNLEKINITDAVTINGLLDPIEKAKSIERVSDGSASILYISPESLRSKTVERLLLGRNVVRFVIDEAHCFSAWGHDFRVDYLYIADFIRSYQEKKNIENSIPVSCFTATAKLQVIEDIRKYFNDRLHIDLEVFNSEASRTNLRYIVFNKDINEKYASIRDLLDGRDCPVIIYVSRTRTAYELAQRLTADGYPAKPYHGKMDKQEKNENQDAFIKGDISIMVATSAFGMGVDKKDVGMIIHHDISDSLENYVQEAGRAGRDENISADCYVLFDEEDLNKHFLLLNRTRLDIKEIQQVWKAITRLTQLRSRVSQSALEIARKAGWDDGITELETRVTTAIAALEEAGFLKRSQNMPRIYADSILVRNAKEAIDRIYASDRFDESQKKNAVRIIRKLISSRSRSRQEGDEAEARVDYISDQLGIPKEDVVHIVNLLREERLLADTKDLAVYIKKKESSGNSLDTLKTFRQIEYFLLGVFTQREDVYHIKELNEKASEKGYADVTPNKIKTVINFWAVKQWLKRQTTEYSRNHITVRSLYDRNSLLSKLERRHEISQFIIEYLYEKVGSASAVIRPKNEDVPVEFSVFELKEAFESRITLLDRKITVIDVEDSLFYLSKIEALKIEGGFLVTYNAMNIERVEPDLKRRYKSSDYQKLKQYYEGKVQQIHIVGEYAKKMIVDYGEALQFVDDYFRLNYSSFIHKYFKGFRQNEIKRNITPAKFRQLFGELSPAQLKIINDSSSKHIVVAAGPGSGKTRILVHKLASLLLMEDVKHEQLLMVTFSRAAATEFKIRLLSLIGGAANYIEIKTFHSYCFDLLGRVGTIDKSEQIIMEAVSRIKNGDVEPGRITKTVLVIDEAQDMDPAAHDLIRVLIEHNDDMRVIAVGDDDQNIYEFRGSSSKYLAEMTEDKGAVMYELVENYRSKKNLVEFTNQFAKKISNRLKKTPIQAKQDDNGKIRLVCYKNGSLITPLVNDLINEDHSGTTCVLTYDNKDALQISGLLSMNGIQARLIQDDENLSLYNILEIRSFLNQFRTGIQPALIGSDLWANAKRSMAVEFAGSSDLELCFKMISDFESANQKYRYLSDLEIFIRESKPEDFCEEKMETVFVSTMHKAKGHEFDNVFIMLDKFDPYTDEKRRILYVAMTRAKKNLFIHYNGNYLDCIKAEGMEIIRDDTIHMQPVLMAKQLTHKDVLLDYFFSCQPRIAELQSGYELDVIDGACCDKNKKPVVKFSKKFRDHIRMMKESGYVPVKGKISHILYWLKKNAENEIRIILPEVYFKRMEDASAKDCPGSALSYDR